MKKVLGFSILLLTVLLFSETLVIKGSNTVFPIAQLWIERLKEISPELEITLEGAGSSTGIAALFNKTADIANSSRWLKESELEKMHSMGRYFIPIVIGYDGIAVIVNRKIDLENITLEMLKKIYTGKIRYWNQIDPNLPKKQIQIYSRNTASGTFETFEKIVLKNEKMAPWVRMVESTRFEVESVEKNPYAIAYIGIGYVTDEVKVLKVEGILPTKETILDGTYPISRPLFMFVDATNGYPEAGAIKKYITFGLSKEGQDLVEKAGYISAYGF
ncbi:phosphate ABC transporter substrate-binding protein [Thermosipho melanesiensis]|uniref:Phosphate-binding protein n=2 Tax=Thermosipho melanesiensis TaxID=46541 RepID=A6LP13_THEM4|nr:phosphate ABC transporter substrate-binding protein PstS family protein [Thermosipho melanesiensis]ABR31664.1 phosphate binding protein [Thermosipho melanesiensis BI429]APT74691.1 phosphate ABC transporter substrate-binding protein [Thermosipho melanesiensis]OOC35188.1 phosphate ABC transporter substrate-binding protein [Thermosipho melanesiensis]OOC35398.1 phosphate ABC transporter substrate-binding protein [Thermosipho melanesiensis]OOC36649.1 phosphate ABC transporter substrate-binding p